MTAESVNEDEEKEPHVDVDDDKDEEDAVAGEESRQRPA